MLIKYAQPVEGKRELMCGTDEARVSRIHAPGSQYDGMVERLQPAEDKKPTSPRFFIKNPTYLEIYFGSPMLHYHYFKFLSLVAAKSLFPSNFCDAGELRVFHRRGKLQTAMYSDFVDDENGVIERRRLYMRAFYKSASESGEAANRVRAAMNERERQLNPDLAGLEGEISAAGIFLIHPECNYHISHGSTVFFEIGGIDIRKSAGAAEASDARLAFGVISLLHALDIIRVSRYALPGDCDKLKPRRKEILDAGLEEIHDIVHNLMTNRIERSRVFDPNEFGKWGLEYWRDVIGDNRNPIPRPRTYELIDPKAYLLLMEDQEQRLNP
jgi:hypothetical protein